jgi:chromosome segregation ATPase
MTNTHKLDEAFERFEQALRQFESAITHKAEGEKRVEALESEAETLRRDRSRLAHELDLVRSKAGELVDTSKNAAGKIDAAMSRIRAVLHSNSGD